jgi:hypothetical protein
MGHSLGLHVMCMHAARGSDIRSLHASAMGPLLGDDADTLVKQFIDVKLLTKLQQHQSTGVVFMLRCILGLEPAQER